MSKQPERFVSPSSPRPDADLGVVLVPGPKDQLSKSQATFRRLVRRVEKLRKQIEKRTEQLNQYVEYEAKHVRPLRLELGEVSKSTIRLVFPFWLDGTVKGKNRRQVLANYLRERFESVIDAFGQISDADLVEILEKLEGRKLEEAHAEEFESMRSDLGEIFGRMGLDVDLSKLRPGMSDEEVARELAGMKAEFERVQQEMGENEARSKRPKTKRQLEKAERERQAEELRKRDLGSLYRQLAKLLHPDLEQDPALRAEKEAAMKELTTAYKDEDLHSMLHLELKWIEREDADLSRLTDAKLGVYNQVLKEQVAELEAEYHAAGAHPRYQTLARYMDPFFGVTLRFDGPREKSRLIALLQALRASTESLRGPSARESVQALVDGLVEFYRHEPAWLR